jgi:hypothetical protein
LLRSHGAEEGKGFVVIVIVIVIFVVERQRWT